MQIGTGKSFFVLLAALVLTFCLVYSDLLLCREIYSHDTIVWFGSFHYYVTSLASGYFPYWDPYLATGTYFYPNMPLHGLLEPVVLIEALLAKVFHVQTMTLYVYLRLFRLFVFAAGAYYFFRFISKSRISSLLAAGVLLFAVPHSYFPQFGTIDTIYLTPFVLYFFLRFFEDPEGPRRYIYISCIGLLTGISMIIYIPAFYLFNVLVFIISGFALKAADFRAVARSFRNRRLLGFSAVALVAVILMTAPPFMTMSRDTSSRGELFPMQRIVQKNDRVFKKIMATEINTNNLSDKFTNQRAIFNSWGNIAGMFTPDIFDYWMERDLVSYIHQYIGIIPLVLCIIGFIYHKSRYRYLILIPLIVMFINGFSSSGVHDRPFNLLQRFFNTIFPPLGLYQGRENFGYFVLLYLCAFLSMGLSLFFERLELFREKYLQIIGICIGIIMIRTAVVWYFSGQLFFVSLHDLFVICQLLFLGLALFLYRKGMVPRVLLYGAVVFLILADLGIYNQRYKKDVLQDGSSFYQALASAGDAGGPAAEFQYFREPLVFMPMRHPLAFEESIWKTKGALSAGFNHSLFTTKRYYDFFTHLPLRRQFMLDGVVYPVIQFYPMDRVRPVPDKRELLDLYARDSTDETSGYLYIEEPAGRSGQSEVIKDFGSYEDVREVSLENIFAYYPEFIARNEGLMRDSRENLGRYLQSPDHDIEVKAFSVNEIAIQVRNSQDGYLYYNDSWSRYWQAFDRGREIPVKIANYNFKAVFLAPGDHLIRFVFNPRHYKAGLIAYYTGLLLSLGMVVLFYLRGRGEEKGSDVTNC